MAALTTQAATPAVTPRAVTTRRPLPVTALVVMLVFLGLTAVAGGIALTFGGEGIRPSADWLDAIPLIDTWVIPGLVLGIGFGIGSLVTAYGVARRPRWGWTGRIESRTRHHRAWGATMLIGAGHVVWIALELIDLPELSWLQALYGPLGLALLLVAWLPPLRDHLERRD
jgi:hypothetical protein